MSTPRLPSLASWLADRRWYAGQADPAPVTEQRVELPTTPPLTVVVATTAAGDRYQLVARTNARPKAHDAADEPRTALALARFVAEEGAAGEAGARVAGHAVPGAPAVGRGTSHPIGGEQSNTSVVVGGTHVLKVLRRLQPGANPEVEVGRHLAAVAARGRPVPVAALAGWYDLDDPDGPTTLGVLHELVPGALDAWALVLSALAGDPDGLLPRLHHLGRAVAALHDALAEPGTEPEADAFGAHPLDAERVRTVAAGIGTDEPAAAALAERLAAQLGDDLGAAIRHHGDLHLGQVVLGPDGWVVLDFEEPNRPVAERRRPHSPLRDVAGMLRSFAYAAATHRRSEGRRLAPGWEPAARAAFLDGYLSTVDPAILPASAAATSALLRLFELEKVVYEVGYERSHRPDWVDVPLEGLHLLLGEEPA
ncbi:MAG: phosphotransferase [Acidimicrobiales bacterium]